MLNLLKKCSVNFFSFFAFALVLTFASSAFATTGITLPDTGVDVGAHVKAAITALGLAVLAAVGGFFAFLVIRKALQWARLI